MRLPLNVATLYYGTCLIEVIVPGDVPVRNLGEPKWAAKWAKLLVPGTLHDILIIMI